MIVCTKRFCCVFSCCRNRSNINRRNLLNTGWWRWGREGEGFFQGLDLAGHPCSSSLDSSFILQLGNECLGIRSCFSANRALQVGFVFHVALTHSPNRLIILQLVITGLLFGTEEIQLWVCQVSDSEVKPQWTGKDWGGAALCFVEHLFWLLKSSDLVMRVMTACSWKAPSEGGFADTCKTHLVWLKNCSFQQEERKVLKQEIAL